MTHAPIHIDLRNLSEEHLAQCMPHLGKCKYSAPCIIGTLIPPEQRAEIVQRGNHSCGSPYDNVGISELIECGVITMPPEQRGWAGNLQSAFDMADESNLSRIVRAIPSKFGPPPEALGEAPATVAPREGAGEAGNAPLEALGEA